MRAVYIWNVERAQFLSLFAFCTLAWQTNLQFTVLYQPRFGFPREIPRNSRGKGNFYKSDVISATGI